MGRTGTQVPSPFYRGPYDILGAKPVALIAPDPERFSLRSIVCLQLEQSSLMAAVRSLFQPNKFPDPMPREFRL
jgi:hypothetical protein